MLRAVLNMSDLQAFSTLNDHEKPQTDFGCLIGNPEQSIDRASGLVSVTHAAKSIWISMTMDQLEGALHFAPVLKCGADTVFLRGCQGPDDIEKASVLLTVFEIEAGISENSIRIAASCTDSARAVQNLPKWTFRPDRLGALVYDPIELSHSLGLVSPFSTNGERLPLLETAAHMCLFAAGALACPIYDSTVWPAHINVSQQYLLARRIGFAGAMTADPKHIDMISAIFARDPR